MKVFWCLMRWILFLAVCAGAVASFKWVISVDDPNKTALVFGGMIASLPLVVMFGKIIYWENLFVTILGFLVTLVAWCLCVLFISPIPALVAIQLTVVAFCILALCDPFRNRVFAAAAVWFTVNDDSKNPISA